jgi:hypothetical protein
MTDRKPINVEFSSWIEGQITQARAKGEFDNLPGAGKPIADLGTNYDANWWVKSFMAREDAAWLPETLLVRRDVERVEMAISRMSSERAVAEYLTELNARIMRANTGFAAGPPANVLPVDADELLEDWRTRRDARRRAALADVGAGSTDAEERRRAWIAAALIAAQAGIAGGLVAALM